MNRDLVKTDRPCPKCKTVFGAVTQKGVCPKCGHVFYYYPPDALSLKDSELTLLARAISSDDAAIGELVRSAIETKEQFDPLTAVLDALEDRGFIGLVDWSCDPEEVQAVVEPLLVRRGIKQFDWSFAEEFANWEDMDAEEAIAILYRLADAVDAVGLVLTNLYTDSDNFVLTVLTPDEFAQIEHIEHRRLTVTDCHAD